ncbi:hypothetical protein J7E78_15530 [Paenibacillus polymyxa]|uniref:hypothetical protein n=1 Tax=Paenibacillus polymyxa TaxID=1406 RepID=UPI001BED1052|nr:hypothetical protein [Paenibacillus polymyxa]MBT2284952.1 hypothetical protein [Paenibacillus polymyxa]
MRHGLKHVNDTGISFRPFFEIEGAESFAHNINTSRLAYVEHTADISRTIKAYMLHSRTDRISIFTREYDIPLNTTLGNIAEDYVIETLDMYHILVQDDKF